MKRLIYRILILFFSLHALFGLYAMINMVFLRDAFSFIVYFVWFLSGLIPAIVFIKKLKKFSRSPVASCEEQPELPNSNLGTIQEENHRSDIPEDDHTPIRELTFPDTYIAFDVETPNHYHDRISQIGLIIVENGRIIKDYSSLINPEVYFDAKNTEITGIDSDTVLGSPTFSSYWPLVSELFERYTVIAHNASFDLSVLYKTLLHYGIHFPNIQYVCTMIESKNFVPDLGHYSLHSLCEYFNIHQGTEHHALFDAQACSSIFEAMKSLEYDIKPSCYEPSTVILHDYDSDSKNDIVDIPFSNDIISDMSGKRVVLTGIFTLTDKNKIQDFVVENGGRVTSAVSSLTDYLIVGSKPEASWKHGNYGTKIEKAISLIDSNKSNVKIIREEDFIHTFTI